jgi:hypothetical protein
MVSFRPFERIVEAETPVFPLRPVHASHDMISLLNLTGLHATHVRPYAATSAEDGQVSDDEGQGPTSNRARRRMKIEKGYQHLLPDCIGSSLPTAVGGLADRKTLYRQEIKLE